MKVTTSPAMAVQMTATTVTRALMAAGYLNNDIKSVQQDDNLCLFWDDMNSKFIVTPVHLKYNDLGGPNVRVESESQSVYQVAQRGTILGEFGQSEIEYESMLFAVDDEGSMELAEHPDKHVTHENLKYCDVFTTGLMMKYLGNAYTAQGVNMERKQVLLEQHGKYVEYGFVLKDNNDFEIVGLPIRTWA